MREQSVQFATSPLVCLIHLLNNLFHWILKHILEKAKRCEDPMKSEDEGFNS